MITAEVSLYPQKTTNASQIINDSINSLDKRNLQVNVGSISTRIKGSEEEVWEGIKSLFKQAGGRNEVNMVVTLSNCAD
ncbi:MAG: YkoF family thiamine/hydroxymethylpyrimidine-binding protein [Bacillota bacterium]